jgi:hypothetical protein
MKIFFRLILMALLVIPSLIWAQLPNGSIAPNFTGTDLDGNTYTLYDLLDQGKTVIMDVSATWCGPCWGYHQSHALKDTWTQYGPNGTNEIVVLFIEGDAQTNLACLQGDEANCSKTTQGNWIANTPYPIIDDASIGGLYQIGYFPTIFAICPNRRLIEINQVGPAEFSAFAQNCPEAVGANNAGVLGLVSGTNSDYYCGPTNLRPSSEFQNLGNQPITSAKFSLSINGSLVQEKTWTGNLATYEVAKVVFDPYLLVSEEIVSLDVNVTAVNDANDDETINDTYSTLLVPNQNIIEQNRLRFELVCDAHPEQTRWEFRNSNGDVLYSGGNPLAQPGANTPNLTGGYNLNQFIKDTFLLPVSDCYEFYIVDDRGNGISFGSSYKLMLMDGTIVVNNTPFGAVHSELIEAVNISTSNTTIFNEQRVGVYPNPTNADAIISWDNLTFEPSSVKVTDFMGKLVEEKQVSGKDGKQNILENKATTGLYFVTISGTEKSVSQKLVVIK